MGKTKRRPVKKLDPEMLARKVEQYEALFDDIEQFVQVLNRQEDALAKAQQVAAAAKEKWDAARDEVTKARDARDGTEHSLFRYLRPGPAEILPLFDRMEEADEEKHGANAGEWRKEPLTVLRLSLTATDTLSKADIIIVGQLQDRILANPELWWEKIDGLTAPIAASIADLLAEYIEEQGDA